MAKRCYGNQSIHSVHDIKIDDVCSDTNDMPVKTKKSHTSIILLCVFIILLCSAALFFGLYLRELHRTAEVEKVWKGVQDIANTPEETSDSKDPTYNQMYVESAMQDGPMYRHINFEELKKVNDDVLCWIYIPDTPVDYPVLQEQIYGTYRYLRNDIYGKPLVAGCLFVPKEPDGFDDKDAHMLIFGHNMMNGTMFSILKNYADEDFYTEHRYIYLYYPTHTEKWEVWTAYHTRANDMVYDIPYEYQTNEYQILLNDIDNRSEKQKYKTNAKMPTTADKILCLSTCDKANDSIGRYLVNAVKVETIEAE